jgi:CRISPR/Cas system-associated endonuclease Cas1
MKPDVHSWPSRLNLEPEKVEQGLAKLVLSIIELIRQLLERQAIHRMEAGSLSPEETERLGVTLMNLEKKMEELKEHFGIDDLNLNLGPLGNLVD